MACKTSCRLCDRLVISDAVYYSAANGVVIDVPANTFKNGEKVCIVIAQNIPTSAVISAPVVITIGGVATYYPLITKCCKPVTVCAIRTRTRYSTHVVTTASGGSFKLMGDICDCPDFSAATIGG